jgi:hypothetical protein
MLVVSAAACLDAQREVILMQLYMQTKNRFYCNFTEFGAIRSKLAEMATSVMLGRSAT